MLESNNVYSQNHERKGPALAVLDGLVTIFGGDTKEVEQITESGDIFPLESKLSKHRRFPSVVVVPKLMCKSGKIKR
jgi:hypothetical protein